MYVLMQILLFTYISDIYLYCQDIIVAYIYVFLCTNTHGIKNKNSFGTDNFRSFWTWLKDANQHMIS